MKIEVRRFEFNETCTIGSMFINGVRQCFTLEDKVREVANTPVEQWKIAGNTAIPAGIYKVIRDYSQHFKSVKPHLLNVPGFEGIRIHSGNTDKDTEGCILVGETRDGNIIGNSKKAFTIIDNIIDQALLAGETVTLEIG